MDYGTVIGLVCLVVNGIIFLKSYENGLACYITLLFIAPNILDYSYELVGFLLVLAFFVMRLGSRRSRRKWDSCDWMLIILFGLIIFSSALSSLVNSVAINIISIFGMFRIFFLGIILRDFFSNNQFEKLKRMFYIILFFNVIAGFVQMYFPSSVQFFYTMYYRSSLTPLEQMLELGYFSRVFGTFGTPISLAIFLLMSFSMQFYQWYKANKFQIVPFLLMGIILVLGVFTYSKTFYFGVPICIVTIMAYCAIKRMKIQYAARISTMIIIGCALLGVLFYLAQDNATLSYYLSFFKDPLKIFETRYGDEGNLLELKQIIAANLFIGVGETNLIGEFIGDSAFYTMLHSGGILGLGLYLLALFRCTYLSFKNKNACGILFIAIIIICGVASSTFTMTFASLAIGVAGSKYNTESPLSGNGVNNKNITSVYQKVKRS